MKKKLLFIVAAALLSMASVIGNGVILYYNDIFIIASLPDADFSASETTIVEGDAVQFTDLSTNAPVEWHWYFEGGMPAESVEQHPEVLYATAGKYDVKLVVSNATGSDSVLRQAYITVTELIFPPIADFIADCTEIKENQTVTFTNLSQNNPDTYHWFFEGGAPEESVEQNPVIHYHNAGTYSVSLTATNEAGESTELKENYITVTPEVSIAEQDARDEITVYPNPTTGELRIENGENNKGINPLVIEIFDIYGRNHTPHTSYLTPHTSLDISHLSSGIYFVKITTEAGIVVKKVVKE